MRNPSKRHWKVAAAIVALFVFGMGTVVFLNLPKPIKSEDSAYDLMQLPNGTYIGSCYNGLVQVQVEVEIQNHTMSDVRITRHQNGMGGSAESIVDDVRKHQSVEVDAVTGATMSSQTILKAIENALSTGLEK